MRHSLLIVLIAMACARCGGSPTSPTAPIRPSAPFHDTLNATGDFGGDEVDGFTSEWSGASDVQMYDDFMSPAAATIRTVAWQGIRYTARAPASFYISFIAADNNGLILRQGVEPNSTRPRALHATSYSVDRVNERLSVTRACRNSPQQQCGSYDYSVTLTTPFTATVATRYWVLIQAESPPGNSSGWGWRRGRSDNTFALSNQGAIILFDFAFALRP